MNYIVKTVIFLYLILELIIEKTLPYEQLFVVLLIIAVNIFQERYYDSISMSIVTLLLTCIGAAMDFHFVILFALSFYDFTLKKAKILLAATLLCMGYFLGGNPHMLSNAVLIVLCTLLAYGKQKRNEEENRFIQTLDNERRLRYELEQTKAKLLHSSKEIANIAEVKERNRIAREIHDSIGHHIAGILIQLQAAYKVHASDEAKSMDIVKKSIDGLAGAVELLRDTVHNIKPQKKLGVEYIHSLIANYGFCPVELKLQGDFNTIPPSHLEILSTNIKEGLTNASRYSQATKLEIAIDVNDQYTRLYMKDNGIGSKSIKEGLGLSGMKERVKNMGGSFSVSANDGFLIVCLIPRQEGGGIFEGAYRR